VGTVDLHVVWFKRDLRVRDHEPLTRAAERGPVLPLYIVEPDLWRQPDSAAQHYAVIEQSLTELRATLSKLGSPLIVRTGEAVTVFQQLMRESEGFAHIWAHEETGNNFTYRRDRAVLQWARASGVAVTEIPHDFVVRRLTSRDDWSAIARERMAQPIFVPPAKLNPVALRNGSTLEPGPIPTRDGRPPDDEVLSRDSVCRVRTQSLVADHRMGWLLSTEHSSDLWDGVAARSDRSNPTCGWAEPVLSVLAESI
jgi:deoxyribodipyrimidine photo-lyase